MDMCFKFYRLDKLMHGKLKSKHVLLFLRPSNLINIKTFTEYLNLTDNGYFTGYIFGI